MCHENAACWVGRADALILWRGAPSARPLVVTSAGAGVPILDADQLQSTAAGGVRGSLLRVDSCCGDAWELTYLYAGNFTAQRALPGDPAAAPAFALAAPGIYGNNSLRPFTSGSAGLLARLQTAEFNRHFAEGPNWRWLAGFRWLQWQEDFTFTDHDATDLVDDFYRTNCVNDLYGGQIGIDARLFTLSWLRLDSVVKAGAYYNAAVQDSTYVTTNLTDPAQSGTASVRLGQSPASCSFVGEVGLTGVMPITPNLDFRFGYLGLFLTGLAQPTQQLSGQSLPVGGPTVGTLTAIGGTVVQGVTLGLEGRW